MVGGGGEGRAGESLPWWRILGWRVEERPLPASPASVCPLPPWDPSSQHLPLYPRHPSVPPYSFPSSSSGPPSLLNSPPTPAGSLLPCSHPPLSYITPPVVRLPFQLASPLPGSRTFRSLSGQAPSPGPAVGSLPPGAEPGSNPTRPGDPGALAGPAPGGWAGRGMGAGSPPGLGPRGREAPEPASRAPPPQPGRYPCHVLGRGLRPPGRAAAAAAADPPAHAVSAPQAGRVPAPPTTRAAPG